MEDKKKLETQSIGDLRQRARDGEKIVFTNGCFDILHIGHIRLLDYSRALGDCLVVGLNSDASIKRLKGIGRPIVGQEDRQEMLLAIKAVDYVFIFDDDTPYNLIAQIAPDVLVKGGDWPLDKIVGSDIVLAKGGDVISFPFVPGRSTTRLIETIVGL